MRLTRVTLFFVAIILALGFYRLSDYLLEDTEAQTFQATEEMMVDTAHILAALIESENEDLITVQGLFEAAKGRSFEATIFAHTKKKVGINVYVTDHSGVIIYDSGNPERAGDDYSMMNDVKKTLAGGYGVRSSRTDKSDDSTSVMHVSAPIMEDDIVVGCVTVYKAQADVRAFIDIRERDIITGIALIGTGVLFLIVAVFIWLFRPIGTLTEYARSISRGERTPKPEVGLGREVNTLADALHDMRESLEGRKYADQYIQTLTHELKSPLAAIKGAAELIDDKMPAKDRDHFLDNIRQQTNRCERMILRLLELSAVEAQSHLENLPRIDVVATCQQSVEDMTAQAEAADVKITSSFPEPCALNANERLLRSAISQLLENAIQFSPARGVVNIAVISDQNSIKISVTDGGPGIPDFAAERAFERFYSYRKDAPEHGKGKGNGLGLSFVREVAELHNGTATIGRRKDRGTTAAITLTLPEED